MVVPMPYIIPMAKNSPHSPFPHSLLSTRQLYGDSELEVVKKRCTGDSALGLFQDSRALGLAIRGLQPQRFGVWG